MGWTWLDPDCRASNTSVTGLSTSYSTFTIPAAARAIASVSAATVASTSPTKQVVSPSATSTGQSMVMEPIWRLPGISFAVSTLITPGSAWASETSTRSTLALGWSEKRRAPKIMPGSFMSPTKTRSPRTDSRPVYFPCRVPTRPVPRGISTALPSRRASAAHSMESMTFL